MPHLEFFKGDQPLFVHRIRPGVTRIGRSDSCDLALPGDSVSRMHCTLEQKENQWWLVDRSLNGTMVNDTAVARRVLRHGDTLTIGVYRVLFSTSDQAMPSTEFAALTARTTTEAVKPALHEEPIDVHEGQLTLRAAELVAVSGPHNGTHLALKRSRVYLGGPGSTLELDDTLPKNACCLRVVRGRVMVDPGLVPTWLDGHRVREITPALPGELLRIGEHTFSIQERVDNTTPPPLKQFGQLVGSSLSMRKLYGMLGRMAAHDATVLLCGESGTGKELAAEALHREGPRCDGPLVAVNCAGIPDNLFESELFGHEKGAFTGATKRTDGAFRRANGGTLFLDEVGELKLNAQAKLLRALEAGEVRRLGGTTVDYPDVRVVAATNRDLPQMVKKQLFRSDLFFRLAVLTVYMPALRHRAEDLPELVATLLARHHPGATLSQGALEALATHRWPGNVRELRNVLTRAVVLGGPRITANSLSFQSFAFPSAGSESARTLQNDERDLLMDMMQKHGGNRSRAAKELGMPRSTLLYKLQKFGIT